MLSSSTILLTIALAASISRLSESCPDGWFGTNCSFLCHCENAAVCDLKTGACPEKCNDEWFGPGCQYSSVQYNTDASWLTDMDDDTCNDGSLTVLNVQLISQHLINWIRIMFDDSKKENQFQLRYTSNDSVLNCNLQTARVDRKTVDIHCPTKVKLGEFTLFGPGVKTMCSMYISGGRNLALNEPTTQSTTSMEFMSWDSGKAVDGIVPGIDEGQPEHAESCSATVLDLPTANWSLTFTKEVYIYKIFIYNERTPSSINCCEKYLKGFTIFMINELDDEVYHYTDPERFPKDNFTVIPSTRINQVVKSLRITKRTGSQQLRICELFAFGEIKCDSGKFGRVCQSTCNCLDPTPCFVSTGGCPTGCLNGFTGEDCLTPCPMGTYGPFCDYECSEHCVGDESRCERFEGECELGCEPGWHPPQCAEGCGNGTYGKNCAETCSENCGGEGNLCDPVSGHCLYGCDPGFWTPTCVKGCNNGTYGAGCNMTCHENCMGDDDRCDPTNGHCVLGCEPGFWTPLCTEGCPEKTYGAGCDKLCSQHCFQDDGTCDPANGSCYEGCEPGYKRPQCQEVCDPGFFGIDCKSECSKNCLEETCDHITGTCIDGCKTGFTSELCAVSMAKNEKKEESSSMLLIISLLFLLLILAIILFILGRRKTETLEESTVSKSPQVQDEAGGE